ncbi:MAG: hypothetical protein IK080_02910 [Clostridia bacterium]|nr:hypothetical protein [Clostridia bacterium]
MKKAKQLLCALLALILCAGICLPASADEFVEPEPTWQNYIESVTPVGDAPYMKLELTPKGYQFTDVAIPRQYDVVFKDGTTKTYHVSSQPYFFNDGYWFGSKFDVDCGDDTITLYADLCFYDSDGISIYEIGQYILTPYEEDGETYEISSFLTITEQVVEPEIDNGSLWVQIQYFFYRLYWRIRSFLHLV